MGSFSHFKKIPTLFGWLALLGACTSPPPPPVSPSNPRAPAPVVTLASGPVERAAEGGERALDEAEGVRGPAPGNEVPVTVDDPIWGDPFAPVTLVIWGDYEDPFTSRLMGTLAELKARYGSKRLRVVWKQNPLPFHRNARPAAIAAETVLRLGGQAAFWKFHERAFANQRSLSVESFEDWAEQAGVSRSDFRVAFEQGTYEGKVDRDLALGKTVGVRGTPYSMINGRLLSGAQPLEKFQAMIDEGLAEAEVLVRSGVPLEQIYAQLSDKNIKLTPPPAAPPPDLTVWKVPLDGSPVRGPANAPVTIVMFGDFQCPFCARAIPTLTALEAKYGGKIRLVFKHHPLPFHPRAEPSAQFAIEAGAQKGEAMFWKAFDLLFANQRDLTDTDLEGYAVSLGLDAKRIMKAIASHAHQKRIDRDADLASDLEASGTPQFFINGRRLIGAQPMEKFQEVIDEQIGLASKLVAEGTKPEKVYEALQKDAKPPKPTERIVLPAPTKANPGKGAGPSAPVVVQFFGDFQCPFCKREQAVLDELINAYPGKVRVVWRHLPLTFHPDALRAAEASVEAFKQKGDAGFWAFAAKLYEDQSSQGLSRESILRKAGEAGLDEAKMAAALDSHQHKAAVQADADLAARFSLHGTPAIVVGDYFVAGAMPRAVLERWVKKSLGPHEPITPELRRKEDPKAKADIEPVQGSTWSASSTTPAGPRLGAKHLIVMYAGSKRAPATVTRSKDQARALAAEALKKIRAGSKFEDIVTAYSDEPGAAARGGDLGMFPKSAMVKPFGDAVEALQVGQVSEVVETEFGFHVIIRTQ